MCTPQAAMLDEMDAVFGVSELLAEDERRERQRSYTRDQLRGLRVAHDIDAVRATQPLHNLLCLVLRAKAKETISIKTFLFYSYKPLVKSKFTM